MYTFPTLAAAGVVALGLLGSADAAPVMDKRIPGVIPLQSTAAGYWTSPKCWWDPFGNLASYTFTNPLMTVEICTSTCQSKGYTWAGVELGTNCQCGNGTPLSNNIVGPYQIDMANCQYTSCPGNPSVACGGVTAALIYFQDQNAVSSSASASRSASLSLSQSLSQSISQSISASAYASASLSQSLSASRSASVSQSISASQSLSASLSASTAASIQAAQSLAASVVASQAAASQAASLSVSQSVSASISASIAASQAAVNQAASLSVSQSVSASVSASIAASVAASQAAASQAANVAASQSLSLSASVSASQAASLSASQSLSASISASQAASLAASASASASSASAAAALATSIPSPWVAASVPCIAEGTNGRALTGSTTSSGSSMTLNQCMTFCSSGGFSIAGLEFSGECYCGNALVNGATTSLASSQCTMPCSGSSSTICGGSSALSLYVIPSKIAGLNADLTAKSASLPSGWSAASTSCIAEGTTGRALTGASTSSANMTVPQCATYCTSLGFGIAGVEYANQCFCGNSLSNGASLNTPSNSCNMFCAGDQNSICGGPNALTLVMNPALIPAVAKIPTSGLPSGWSAASSVCIQEVSNRALVGASTSSASMTVPTCLAFCASKGFQYAGVEYGQECYCGASLANGASLSQTSGQCNMPCAGDSTSICGGPNALQLYSNPSYSSAAAAPVKVNGMSASGCIQEVSGRALTGLRVDNAQMTIEICTSACAAAGFSMAGVEYGTECYCGNSLVNGASTSLVSGQCKMACPGNAAETCGGPNAIQLYSV